MNGKTVLFKSSSLNRPLKPSIKAFWVSFPRTVYFQSILRSSAKVVVLNRRQSVNWSETKSSDLRWFGIIGGRVPMGRLGPPRLRKCWHPLSVIASQSLIGQRVARSCGVPAPVFSDDPIARDLPADLPHTVWSSGNSRSPDMPAARSYHEFRVDRRPLAALRRVPQCSSQGIPQRSIMEHRISKKALKMSTFAFRALQPLRLG